MGLELSFKTLGLYTDPRMPQIKKEKRVEKRSCPLVEPLVKVLRGYQYNTPLVVKFKEKFGLFRCQTYAVCATLTRSKKANIERLSRIVTGIFTARVIREQRRYANPGLVVPRPDFAFPVPFLWLYLVEIQG